MWNTCSSNIFGCIQGLAREPVSTHGSSSSSRAPRVAACALRLWECPEESECGQCGWYWCTLQMFVSGVADVRLSTTTNCESENDNLKCESEDGCVFNLLEIEEESNLSFEGAACARLGKEKPQQILDPVDCLPVNLDSSLSRSNMSKTSNWSPEYINVDDKKLFPKIKINVDDNYLQLWQLIFKIGFKQKSFNHVQHFSPGQFLKVSWTFFILYFHRTFIQPS